MAHNTRGSFFPGYWDEIVRALHAVVSITAEGKQIFRIAGASLTALKKDGATAVSPWERLFDVSESLAGNRVRGSLLGFGTANGCEAIVHAVRRCLKSHRNDGGQCLLTMELENMSNQIDRSCFLRKVQRVARGLRRYCDLCYSNDSFVLFGPETIFTRRGTAGRPPRTYALRPVGSTVDMAAFYSTTEPSAVPTKPRKPSSQAS